MPSLSPLEEVLGMRRAKHLLRRASYCYTKTQLSKFAVLTATDAVNLLFESGPIALGEPYDPYPASAPDGYWTSSLTHPKDFSGQGRKRAIVTAWWWYNAINSISIKYKLTSFLYNSFTTGKDSGAGYSTQFYDYLRTLDHYALGNIKALAKRITTDNAMLSYLDNTKNNANNPNENYAREFLELFTILKGPQISEGDYTNYTETDVQQAARVFSGFKVVPDRSNIDPDSGIPWGYANNNKHDKDDKQFSHAFNNHVITGRNTAEGMYKELDDFVAMVFDQEATSIAYCRRLYRFFVKRSWSLEVEQEIIIPMAQTLRNSNYEIVPVVKQLLTSRHFFDADDGNPNDEHIGAIIKNPIQAISEIVGMFRIELPSPNSAPEEFYVKFFQRFVHNSYLRAAGMDFFNPDSVAGYPAYYQEPDYDRHWFASNTIIARYKLIESLLLGKNTIFSGNTIFTRLDTVHFIDSEIDDPNNVDGMISQIANLFYPEAISENRIAHFSSVLLDDYDSYYWANAWGDYKNTGNDTSVKIRLDALIKAMINAAEFQLM